MYILMITFKNVFFPPETHALTEDILQTCKEYRNKIARIIKRKNI